MGYDREQVLFTTFFHREIRENIPLIKQRLAQNANIESTALSVSLPTNTNNQGILSEWEGNDEKRTFGVYRYYVDYDFLDLYKMEMVEGRYFSPAFPADSSRAYIINQAALDALGWTSAVGKSFRDGKVIGVVKDFHFQPFDLQVEPLFMLLHTPQNRNGNYGNLSIRIKDMDQAETTIAFIESTFKDIAPMIPIEARFLENTYNQLYNQEQRLSKVFNAFTILAMFIACLGLFGLVSFNLVQRTKEIGIRKVLGASSISIVNLLSQDFLKLVIISVVLAVPIGWYAMSQWLQSFAYSIQIKWWVFLITGLSVITLAMLTVFWQSFKASVAD
ncbi:MAG: FtsX-like permease family protein, partial [Bacteroidota bacterium]